MSFIDELTVEELDEEQQALVDCIGFEAYKKLIATYAGCQINICMPETVTAEIRNRHIRKEFDGFNYKSLALKYSLSERRIRQIVNSK